MRHVGRTRITGGRVIDPANAFDGNADVFIDDGKVVAVASDLSGFTAERTIDASGLVVCPGLVDLRANLREPGAEHKATIASETRAAAASGITTLCMTPDTDPVIDTPAVAELISRRASASGFARVEVLGALTRGLGGEVLAEIGTLGAAGCRGVSNALSPVASSEVMRRAMEYAASFSLGVFIHAEDPWLAKGRLIHDGALSTRLGIPGIPAIAETIMLARELLLTEETGANVHFCHISTAPAVDMLRDAIAHGLPVSADVAIHQLHLTDNDVDGFDSLCHVRPPLRTASDRAGLRQGVSDGTIGVITSDHQPHEIDAKLNPFTETEPGISGLETLLSLALSLVQDDVLSLTTAIGCMTAHPAQVLGLDRGVLSANAPADICIFDPNARWTPDRERMLSAGRNTPFAGRELPGRVCHTLLGGESVYEREPGDR